MKRMVCCIAVLALLGGVCPTLAEGGTVRIEELLLDVYVPEGYVVFTRATGASDPELLALGLDYGELYRGFLQNDAYLSAIKSDPNTEITVSMRSDDNTREVESFKALDTEALITLGEQFLALGAPADGNAYGYTSFMLHESEQASYLVFDISGSDDGEAIAGRRYQTIHGGQTISFTMISYTAALTREQTDALLGMVQGSSFYAVNSPVNLNNMMLASFGMLAVGGLTVFMALKRNKRPGKSPRHIRAGHTGGMAFCPNCGVRMPINVNYCHACGEWAGNRE